MTAPLLDDTLKDRLAAAYGDGARHYHNLGHVHALLALATQHRALLSDVGAVEAAIWFHDAVYDSRAKDNEARSAALAHACLAGRADAARIERIAAMIEATATHQVPPLADAAALRDASLFLDMDLSILGAAPDAFDAYEQAVRREYGWVDEADWRTGRAAVLRHFLDQRHVFHTDEFRERYERQARQNMARSLEALTR